MRTDLLVLDDRDVARFAAALEVLERLAARLGYGLDPWVGITKRDLMSHLAGRPGGQADTTTRPLSEPMSDDDQMVDTTEAARRLGITEGAVAKRCRSGQFAGVARKQRGQWMIPAADVEAELEKGAA